MSKLNLTRRGHIYGSRNNTNSSSSSKKDNSTNNSIKQKNKTPGEVVLERWIQLAEYEVDIDPYRGMTMMCSSSGTASSSNANASTSGDAATKACPWLDCRSNVFSVDRNDNNATKATTEEEEYIIDPIVRQVKGTCGCKCPSLVSWTNQAHKEMQRKKARKSAKRRRTEALSALPCFGQRPDDHSLRCACDYNPFCWVSLGGVVNAVVMEASIEEEKERQRKQAEREMIDVDEEDIEEHPPPQQQQHQNEESAGGEKKRDPETGEETLEDKQKVRQTEVVVDVECDDEDSGKEIMNGNDVDTGNADSKIVIDLSESQSQSQSLSQISQASQTSQSSSAKMPDGLPDNYLEFDPSKDGCVYSETTAKELKGIRKTEEILVEPIRCYLTDLYREGMASGSTSSENYKNDNNSVDDEVIVQLVQNLIQNHRSLVFKNPLLQGEGERKDDDASTEDNSSSNSSSNHMILSIPPGIQNLGATCYLNTQLQCLAQNMVFLKGIFSWRPTPEGSDQKNGSNNNNNFMDSILSKLQLLLAQMVQGSCNSIDTSEFSKSLGLADDEQQDPNEFARLLFERMHEAFQQMGQTTTNTTTDPMNDLSTLLPRIFEGTTIYATTCSTCQTTSMRSEAFMDLNLPIVRPSNKNNKASSLPQKIIDYMMGLNRNNKDVDTNLQYCLDNYSCEEIFNGDNQYLCDNCGCKRDAKRVTRLGKLPPVLNVQLSRYVFDRQKYVKKKLTDKVLLPHTLYVSTNSTGDEGDDFENNYNYAGSINYGSRTNEGSRTKEYKLCAVMKHLGSSAYRGHYVAEAMDWSSGQWFEFNDEIVTLLESGPSCSYFPSEDDDEVNSIKNRLRGSSDAYNMYYVEKSFLSKCVLDNLKTSEKKSNTVRNEASLLSSNTNVLTEGSKEEKHDALVEVQRKREAVYQQLKEKCFEDKKAAERLQLRRDRIRNEMLTASCDISICPEDGAATLTDAVWVDADQLRKFLSCRKDQAGAYAFTGNEPFLRHKHLLCNHEKPGLHPRIARRGKLLPLPMYNAFESMLRSESLSILNQDNRSSVVTAIAAAAAAADGEDSVTINDCVITPTNGLFCEECCASYRRELRKKLDLVKTLKILHESLDAKSDVIIDITRTETSTRKGTVGGVNDATDDDRYAYVVSRKSLTAVRGRITSLLKKIASAEVTAPLLNCNDTSTNDTDELDSYAEGLDAIDLSGFRFESENNSEHKAKDDKDSIDHKLNSSITCDHGNCNVINNKRLVRYVSSRVWHSLKKVFPRAIEHRKSRKHSRRDSAGDEDDIESQSTDNECSNDEDLCPLCQKAQQEVAQYEERLEKWGMLALQRDNTTLLDLYGEKSTEERRKRNEKVLTDYAAEEGKKGDAKLWLVHKNDIAAWREAVTVVCDNTNKSKKKYDLSSIRCQLKKILLRSAATDLMEKDDVDKQYGSPMVTGELAETMICEESIDARRSKLFSSAVTSLTCKEHNLTIDNAIFQYGGDNSESDGGKSDNTSGGGGKYSTRRVADYVEILNDIQYGAFRDCLDEIFSILIPCDEESGNDTAEVKDQHPVPAKEQQSIDLTQEEKVKNKMLKLQHPALYVVSGEKSAETSEELVSFCLKQGDKRLQIDMALYPCICHDVNCVLKFADEQNIQNEADNAISGQNSAGKKQNGALNEESSDKTISVSGTKETSKSLGSVKEDPILVESDTEDNYDNNRKSSTKYPIFDLRVFEVDATASVHEALTDLSSGSSTLQLMNDPKSSNESASSGSLRRSTRKRKVRFPVGKIVGEDCVQVGLHHNVAALRLFLYEKCETPPGQKLTLVAVTPTSSSATETTNNSDHKSQSLTFNSPDPVSDNNKREQIGNGHQRSVDLPFESNLETLHEVYERLIGSKFNGSDSVKDITQENPWSNIVLLRQSDESFTGTQDALLHSLLELTNSLADSTEGTDKSSNGNLTTKKNSRVERGFQGTFLHQSLSSNTTSTTTGDSSANDDSVSKVDAQKMESQDKKKEDLNTSDTSCGDQVAVRKFGSNDEQGIQHAKSIVEGLVSTEEHDLKEKKGKSPKKRQKVIIMDVSSEDEQVVDDGKRDDPVASTRPDSGSTVFDFHIEGSSPDSSPPKKKQRNLLSNENSERRSKRARSPKTSAQAGKEVSKRKGKGKGKGKGKEKANSEESSRKEVIAQIVDFLMTTQQSLGMDEEKCFNAAEWAAKRNPLVTCIEELSEVAADRYYDI